MEQAIVNYLRGRGFEPTMSDVDAFRKIFDSENEKQKKEIEHLEMTVDNAHEALTAIKASGTIEEDVLEMAQQGLDNKPQPDHVRLG